MTETTDNAILFYDSEAFEALKDDVKTLFNKNTNQQLEYSEKAFNDIPNNSRVYCFLSDEQIKISIKKLKVKECAVGFISHPNAKQTITGFNLRKDIEKSFDELLNSERIVDTDILSCNDEPVLNYLAIGEIVTFLTSKSSGGSIFARLGRFFKFVKRLKHVKAGLFTFKTEDKDPFETAATDVLIVQHGKNSLISRILSEEEYSNDALFHTFIFSPRSIIQLIKAYFLKLFLGESQKNKAFKFLGQLKTTDLKLTSTQDFEYDLDGIKSKSKELIFYIDNNLKLIPSESIEYVEKSESKKIYKVDNLPKGKLKEEVVRKRLPWISHATTEEYKELFSLLRENSRPSQNYVVLMTLSVVLATFGIFADSSPVIIGAMILAPLMSPVISLSMGVLRQDRSLIKKSLITVSIGLLIGYFFAIVLTFITPINEMNREITSRIKPNIIDLGIAVISGAAGAYAFAREEIAKTLAGVAIAVALVPPLAVSGIGVAWLNWEVFFGAFLLLITNLTGMVLAGALTFLFTGYSPFRLARKGVLISFFIVLSLSIPLGYGFFKVVQENQIIQSVNNKEINGVSIEHVKVITRSPLNISLDIVAEKYPTDKELQEIQNEISKIVGKKVELEIGIRLSR
ncbi:MAG: DUF389 domain-containing protein [Brumimicrobium sp.]